MRCFPPLPSVLPFLLFVLFVTPTLAADAAAPEPSTPGALRVTGPDESVVDLPLRHTRVRIDVTAFVARATIEQVFANPFDEPVEAVYTFPLGDRAAVDDFEFIVGDRTVRGEIRRREEARRVYEAARDRGYQAALLEQERPNIFTQSVANLEPGAPVTVRIRTVERLRYEAGVYRLAFPLVVGPRYIPGGAAGFDGRTTTAAAPTPAVPDAPRITPPVLAPGLRSGHDVDIQVSLECGVPVGAIESPSHAVTVARTGTSSAQIRLDPRDTIPNKDFLLRWNVSADRPASAVLAHRSGVDGFFTLLLQPKGAIGAEEASPREIVLVLDTSGSMRGVPLDASKRFVRRAIETLGPDDTFNLIQFAGRATLFSPASLPNGEENRRRALAWMERLSGGGGTEMLSGLRAALSNDAEPGRLRMVFFLTDGYIGNETQIFDAIAEISDDTRVFALGVGSSVNRYLLNGMTAIGNGSAEFLRGDENVTRAVDRFQAWVGKPYITDLEIDWGALPILDVSPEQPRDLYSGQTLSLIGRYVGAGSGEVILRGRLSGRPWETKVRVDLPQREERHATLAALWARQRIGALLLQHPHPTPRSVEAEVTTLALEYRLMSPYTSFVAVDDSIVVNPSGESRTVHQALPIPDGVSFEGVFGARGPAALRTDASGEDGGELEVEDARRIVADPAPVEEIDLQPRGPVVGGALAERKKVRQQEARRELVAKNEPRPPTAVTFTDEFAADLPAPGPSYLRAPAPGAVRESTTVTASRPRHFKAIVGGGVTNVDPDAAAAGSAGPRLDAGAFALGTGRYRPADRIADYAFRVLADLADDGQLTAADGRPALAALLAAQTGSGAVARNLLVHTWATWALLEASAAEPQDPWLSGAAALAEAHLRAHATDAGWPMVPGEAVDTEVSLWAQLVLTRVGSAPVEPRAIDPAAASEAYRLLRRALAAAKSGEPADLPESNVPFARLLRGLSGGRLVFCG